MKNKKKGSTKSRNKSVMVEDIWPQKRDILFRPERLNYVRKLIKNEGCVFCGSRDKGINSESLCVFKSQHAMVVLNKYPYNPGHVLVLPQRHIGDLLALSDAEFIDLQELIRKVMAALMDIYNPGGINLGLNHGAVAGAGIPDHIHYHLVPRWSGDTNFFPLVAETKVLVESLSDTYEKLYNYFKSVKQ